MVKTLMASTAGLTSLARPPVGKKTSSDSAEDQQASTVRAEDDDDKDKDKDKDKDDENSKKSKKAKKAENDDDDDDKDKDKDDDKSKAVSSVMIDQATQRGAALERKKIKAVLASEAGAAAFKANPDKVMRFLTSFQGSQEDAIATLELLGPTESKSDAPAKTNLRERMAESDVPNAGPDLSSASNGSADGQVSSAAAMIIKADRMRRGEKVE